MGTGVVRRRERADDELSRLDGFDRAADLFNETAVLMPHGRGPVDRLYTSIRPQVRTADAGRGKPEHCVRWFDHLGCLAVFESNVARSVKNCSLHCLLMPFI